MASKVLFNATEDELLVEMVAKYLSLYDLESELYKDQIVKDNAWKEIAEVMARTAEDCKKRWRNIKDTYNRRKKKGKDTGSSTASKPSKWVLADMLGFLNKAEHKRLKDVFKKLFYSGFLSIFCFSRSTSVGLDESQNDNAMEETVVDDESNRDRDQKKASEKSSELNHSATKTRKDFEEPLGDSGSTSVKEHFSRPRQYSSKRDKLNSNLISVMRERSQERNEILKSIQQNKHNALDLFFLSVSESLKKLKPELIHEAKIRSLQMVFEMEQRNACENISPSESRPHSATSYGSILSPREAEEMPQSEDTTDGSNSGTVGNLPNFFSVLNPDYSPDANIVLRKL